MKSIKAFAVDNELWKRFKKYCIDKNTTIANELERIIKGILDNGQKA